MVKETEYQKRMAAEEQRLKRENDEKRAEFEASFKRSPAPELKMQQQRAAPEKPRSDQDIKWQAWVNTEKEKRDEREREDRRKAQLTAEQRRQEEAKERAEAQERMRQADRDKEEKQREARRQFEEQMRAKSQQHARELGRDRGR